MPFVIGTAGHIDHGKTALVKALTGQDTDRLKEEKERGISIDLGFAYLDLPDGTRAGVVDVPGHERFIRNMLAGAHGIDLVLFTVAADDGVMPQTEEHLDIVHLLGVRKAIFVVTKVDLAPEARLLDVEEEIRILASGSAFEHAAIVHCSSLTGQGLDDLRRAISRLLHGETPRRAAAYFRLPIDRVFTLQGHGLVVTGTALDGEVRVGDRVRCLPGDHAFRVRSLQVHNEAVERAEAGQRIALNLAGADAPSITRGYVVCGEGLTSTTERFDAWIDVRPTAAPGIRHLQRVKVHAGTAERQGTVILLEPDRRAVGPNESAWCQVALSEPVLLLRGDRFVIRDETARRTIGGGVVVHPWASRHRRREAGLLERLRELRDGAVEDVLRAVIAGSASFGVPLETMQAFTNLPSAELLAALDRVNDIHRFTSESETLYTTVSKWEQARRQMLEALRAFHTAHPLAPGMEMEAARDLVPGGVDHRLFRAIVERLETEHAVAREGSLLRLPTHTVRLQDGNDELAQRIITLLTKAALTPPDIKQLEAESGVPRARMGDVLRVMERERTIVRVSPELYFERKALDDMRSLLLQRLSPGSEVTPATFRDLFGTSRKYAIPLLEWLDREGVTLRSGDVRRMRPRPAASRSDA
jgi:selenocysteine-specific elongation factor